MLKNNAALILILILSHTFAFSQGWNQYFGGIQGDYFYDVIQTSNGGFLAVGTTSSYGSGSSDMYIVKTDSLGKLEWQQVVGGIGNESAIGSTENSAGDFFVTGSTVISNQSDILVVKLNNQGSIVWTQTYGGSLGEAASGIVNEGTNVVISGNTTSFGQGQNDIYLFKIDSSGTMLWDKTIGSLVSETSYGMSKAPNGGFLICGKYTTASYNTGYAALTDYNGDSVWTKIINIGNDGIVRYISCTSLQGDSTFVLVGRGGSSYGTYYATRLDLNGNVINHFTQSGYLRYATDVAPTSDGGFVVNGYPFMKFDYKAVPEWETGLLIGYSVIQATDNGYLSAGGKLSNGYPSNYDAELVKTSPVGASILSSNIPVQGNPAAPYCYGSTVQLSVMAGFDQYQWYNYIDNYSTLIIANSNSNTITVDANGSYYCVMTKENDIIRSNNYYVNIYSDLKPVLNHTGVVAICQPDSTITLGVNNISGSTIQWYLDGNPIPGATTINITPASSGNYHAVRTHFNCGTGISDTVQVILNAPPVITLSPDTGYVDFYPGYGFGCDSVLLSVIPGSGQYYQWYHNGNPIYGNQNTFFATGAGIYHCLVSNSCSSSVSNQVLVLADTIQLDISVNGPLTGCGIASTTLSVSNPSSVYTYQWYRDGNQISGYNATYSPSIIGNYHCRISRFCNGATTYFYSDTVFYNYTKKNRPNISFTGLFPVTCSSDSVQLNISQSLNGTYQWFVDSVAIPGANNSVFLAHNTGKYHCETYLTGCDPIPSHSMFVRNGIPEATISAPITQLCSSGSRTLYLQTNDYINGSYGTAQWSRDGVPISGATYSTLNANQPGIYDCMVANICGNVITNQVTLTATVNNVDITANINGHHICAGDTVTLTATLYPGFTYQWYTSSNTIIPGADTNVLVTSQPGYYYVRYVNGLCTLNSLSFQISHTATVSPNIFSSALPQFCGNGTVTLSANIRPDFTYQWYKDSQILLGETQQNFEASSAGSYVVNIYDSLGCEYISPPKNVFENNIGNFAIYTSTNTNVVCNGDSITLYAGYNGTSYQWYLNNDTIPGATSYSITIANVGLYSVRVTDANGCSGLVSLFINVGSYANVNANITHDMCQDNTGKIVLSSYAMRNVLWSTGETTFTISNLTNGNYTATITDQNGCSGEQTFTVLDLDSIPIVITGNTNGCMGLNVAQSAPNGFASYLWSTGDTTSYILVQTSGTYAVTVTNTFGCTGTDTSVVTFNPLPVITLTAAGPTGICHGDSLKLSVDTGLTLHRWYRNGVQISGATDSIYYAKSRGYYSCRATDTNGCSSMSNDLTVTIVCLPPQDPISREDDTDEPFSVVVYPNPTDNNFYIATGNHSHQPAHIIIYDITGRIVWERNVKEAGTEIMISGLSSGVFTMYIQIGKNSDYIKLIKTN